MMKKVEKQGWKAAPPAKDGSGSLLVRAGDAPAGDR